jgi:hypothetical protein
MMFGTRVWFWPGIHKGVYFFEKLNGSFRVASCRTVFGSILLESIVTIANKSLFFYFI